LVLERHGERYRYFAFGSPRLPPEHGLKRGRRKRAKREHSIPMGYLI
jgi:hypothetical protein